MKNNLDIKRLVKTVQNTAQTLDNGLKNVRIKKDVLVLSVKQFFSFVFIVTMTIIHHMTIILI